MSHWCIRCGCYPCDCELFDPIRNTERAIESTAPSIVGSLADEYFPMTAERKSEIVIDLKDVRISIEALPQYLQVEAFKEALARLHPYVKYLYEYGKELPIRDLEDKILHDVLAKAIADGMLKESISFKINLEDIKK